MKKITLLTTTLLCSVVLSACGGGTKVADSGATPNYGTPPNSIEGKIIIDNGRGTTNNQHAEKGK